MRHFTKSNHTINHTTKSQSINQSSLLCLFRASEISKYHFSEFEAGNSVYKNECYLRYQIVLMRNSMLCFLFLVFAKRLVAHPPPSLLLGEVTKSSCNIRHPDPFVTQIQSHVTPETFACPPDAVRPYEHAPL